MRRALALLILLAAAALGGCCESGRHVYVIDAPDPDLAAALQTCADSCGGVGCGSLQCRAACGRVAALAGDTLVERSLQFCTVTPALDGGAGVQVAINYDTCG